MLGIVPSLVPCAPFADIHGTCCLLSLQEVLVPGNGQCMPPEVQGSSNGSMLSRASDSSVSSLDSISSSSTAPPSEEVQAGVAGAIGTLASEAVEVAEQSAIGSEDSDVSSSSSSGSQKHRSPRGLVVDVHQGIAELARSLATTATATAAGSSPKAGSHNNSGSKGPWWFSLPRLFGKQGDRS